MTVKHAKSAALSISALALAVFTFSGCSSTKTLSEPTSDQAFRPLHTVKVAFSDLFGGSSGDSRFIQSGSVMISHQAPPRSVADLVEVSSADHLHLLDGMREPTLLAEGVLAKASSEKPAVMAPLIGYFPPLMSFVPAENEIWLEVDRATAKLSLYKGREIVKQIQGEGVVSMNSGEYFLQHKQKAPLWYAPNEYFTKRQLAVPPSENRLRYRRGALGDLALYPTTTFPIHSAPLWSDEVGGLRISEADLASIYFMLPVGAPVVVK